MTKTYCDRCGKEISKVAYGWLSRRIAFVKFRMISIDHKMDFEDDDKYICPDCEESYIHWFMHPEEDCK